MRTRLDCNIHRLRIILSQLYQFFRRQSVTGVADGGRASGAILAVAWRRSTRPQRAGCTQGPGTQPSVGGSSTVKLDDFVQLSSTSLPFNSIALGVVPVR